LSALSGGADTLRIFTSATAAVLVASRAVAKTQARTLPLTFDRRAHGGTKHELHTGESIAVASRVFLMDAPPDANAVHFKQFDVHVALHAAPAGGVHSFAGSVTSVQPL
jgi:hypothetical protein